MTKPELASFAECFSQERFRTVGSKFSKYALRISFGSLCCNLASKVHAWVLTNICLLPVLAFSTSAYKRSQANLLPFICHKCLDFHVLYITSCGFVIVSTFLVDGFNGGCIFSDTLLVCVYEILQTHYPSRNETATVLYQAIAWEFGSKSACINFVYGQRSPLPTLWVDSATKLKSNSHWYSQRPGPHGLHSTEAANPHHMSTPVPPLPPYTKDQIIIILRERLGSNSGVGRWSNGGAVLCPPSCCCFWRSKEGTGCLQESSRTCQSGVFKGRPCQPHSQCCVWLHHQLCCTKRHSFAAKASGLWWWGESQGKRFS